MDYIYNRILACKRIYSYCIYRLIPHIFQSRYVKIMFPEQDPPLTWNLSNQAVVQLFKVLFNKPMIKNDFVAIKLVLWSIVWHTRQDIFARELSSKFKDPVYMETGLPWQEGYPCKWVTKKRTLT